MPLPHDIRREIEAKTEFNDARAKLLEEERKVPALKQGLEDSESLASEGFLSGGQRDSRKNLNSQQSLNALPD